MEMKFEIEKSGFVNFSEEATLYTQLLAACVVRPLSRTPKWLSRFNIIAKLSLAMRSFSRLRYVSFVRCVCFREFCQCERLWETIRLRAAWKHRLAENCFIVFLRRKFGLGGIDLQIVSSSHFFARGSWVSFARTGGVFLSERWSQLTSSEASLVIIKCTDQSAGDLRASASDPETHESPLFWIGRSCRWNWPFPTLAILKLPAHVARNEEVHSGSRI